MSSTVIDLGVRRKRIYDFLLVINSNLSHICYRFRDIDMFSAPLPCSTTTLGETIRISG